MEGKKEQVRAPLRRRPGSASPRSPGQRQPDAKRVARFETQRPTVGTPKNSPRVPIGSPPRSVDSFTSAESKAEPRETEQPKAGQVPRPPTFTGFRELPVRDSLVILGLWFLRLFVPWVEAWHEFNLHLLIDPVHWEQHENYFTTQEITVFVVKCLLCLAIALIVDYINFKYPTYFLILLLYMFTPIVGVLNIALLAARGYDRPSYFEWWHKAVVMMKWAMSIPFITFPLQFSSVFNQAKGMSRLAHYNWTAIFSFIEALNACIAYWVVPPHCPTTWFKLIAVWCVIGMLILILIIEVLSLMRWAKPQIMKLNISISICKKKKQKPINGTDSNADLSETPSVLVTKVPTKPSRIVEPKPENSPLKKLAQKKWLLFSLMLIPVTFTSFVYEILKRTRPEESWDKHNSVTGTSMLVSGQVIGIVVVAAVLFVIRKWLTKFHRIPFLNPDVLALGLPLSINAIGLIVTFARFLLLSALEEGDVILGPIPTDEVSVIEFYNVEFRNRSICVHSEYFGPLKIPPRQRATSVLEDPGDAEITFNITLDPRTTPPVATMESFKYKKGVWITYIVTLPPTQQVSTDIEAFYSMLEVIRINDTDNVRPKKEPQIVFFNSYVRFTDGWYYNVSGPGQTETINQKLKGEAIIKTFPPGNLKITYWTEWIALVNRGSHPPITLPLQVENYCVYAVPLYLSSTMKDPSNFSELVPRKLLPFKTMQIAGPNSARLPAKEELEDDLAIILGMTLAGMAKGGAYCGSIFLFWLDFPLTGYCTTFLAVFWILMSLPGELASFKVIDIDVTQIIILLVLQFLFSTLHFVPAMFLYTPKFYLRDERIENNLSGPRTTNPQSQ